MWIKEVVDESKCLQVEARVWLMSSAKRQKYLGQCLYIFLQSSSLRLHARKMAEILDQHTKAKPTHVVVIPYPAQGHINPSLAFAKCLASRGLLVTLIITKSITKSAKITDCPSITIHPISDGSEEINHPETVQAWFLRFRTVFSANVAKFMDEHKSKLVIYDSIMPWILEIVHDLGLLGAAFFTQSAAVSAVFYHLKREELLEFPYELENGVVSLPALPALETGDLPCFTHVGYSEETVMGLLTNQFLNVEKPDWIFFNTFTDLENEIICWMENEWPIKTVGPTFLLGENEEEKHAISMFESKHDACREWLGLRQTGSVVYVSLGSISSIDKQQMEELAFGLIMSNCYFLWVVRSSEVDKLPQDFTCLASEKGLMVEWCNQPQVLAHRALACFVSHCGWNSTIEALSYGVPLIAMAQWIDQITNSKFIEDVWRFGIRVKAGENGIIGREEVAMCIKKVVHGEEGVELKANACKWKDLANKAVQRGGTSHNNIDDLVSNLMCT